MIQLLAQFGGGGITDPSGYFGDTSSSVGQNALTNTETFISNMIGIITTLGGIFFIIYFIWGAFNWITAGGDSGKVQKARDQMIQGILGLIVVVAAYGIIGLVGSVLGLDLLTPAATLQTLIPGP